MSAVSRPQLLQAIAAGIGDYRAGEIATPSAAHVERWVEQFNPSVQDPILHELHHVLSKTYISRNVAVKFLTGLCSHSDFSASWKDTNFLNIQRGGSSQREMLALFSECLHGSTGLTVAECGSKSGPYVYIDDVVFTGSRVRNDLTAWIKTAPSGAKLHVITIAYHSYGKWDADRKLQKACSDAGKSIEIHWWRARELENRLAYKDNSDVFWPSSLPNDADTAAYAASITREIKYRAGSSCGALAHFSSAASRHLLEQELLKGGVRVRNMCPHLQTFQRPLGFSNLETLGFGATIVTFRNCPNNCPLVFWANDPWYPLFPRKNN